MKLALSSRDQRTLLAGGGLALLVLWVYGAYILGPLMRNASRLGQQIQQARDRLSALEAATANEDALRKQHEQLTQTVTSLRSLLPAEEELPSLIETLSDLASQTQVKIQTIFPQRPVGGQEPGAGATALTPVVYKEIPIQIDALAGYHQLGAFLALVESGSKPVRIASLRIAANPREPKRHNVKLLLRSYFATSVPKVQ